MAVFLAVVGCSGIGVGGAGEITWHKVYYWEVALSSQEGTSSLDECVGRLGATTFQLQIQQRTPLHRELSHSIA